MCPCPTDRASLHITSCVEKMQELILDLLSRVCGAQAGATRGGPQRFGGLLGRLTELRTLRHNYLLLTRQQPGPWRRDPPPPLPLHLWRASWVKSTWCSRLSWGIGQKLPRRMWYFGKAFIWYWHFLTWFQSNSQYWILAQFGTECACGLL